MRTFRSLRTVVLAGAATAIAVAGTAFALAGPGSAATTAYAPTQTATRTATTGVVVIETDLGYENGAAAGTGIVVTASGEVLTNNHVIRGATAVKVIVPSSGRSYTATVVGYSVSADIAVLKLQGASGLETVSLGGSSGLRIGQAVTAVGNANGTGTLVTASGAITALGRTITAQDDQGVAQQMTGLIQTDAELQPGDSGGPLLDSAGRVIGIDNAASSSYRFTAAAAEGYAIPIDRALTLARQIVAGKASATVHIGGTAWLGVSVQPATTYGGGYGRYPGYGGAGSDASTSGVIVAGVVTGGPAATAGLEAGDVITTIDGVSVTSPTALVARLQRKQPGATVRIVWADSTGGTSSASVKLGSGPPQ